MFCSVGYYHTLENDVLKLRRLNDGYVYFKHTAFHFARWNEVVLHCSGSIGEQVM